MLLPIVITKLLDRFRNNIFSMSPFRFIITFTIFSFLVTFVTYFFNYALVAVFKITFNNSTSPLENATVQKKIIIACIIAPVLETTIFQWLIIEIMYKKIGTRFAVIISALLFGLSHFYNSLYVINTFFIGLILSTSYVLAKEKKFNPSLITIAVHSLHNIIIFILEIFFHFSL